MAQQLLHQPGPEAANTRPSLGQAGPDPAAARAVWARSSRLSSASQQFASERRRQKEDTWAPTLCLTLVSMRDVYVSETTVWNLQLDLGWVG